MTSFSSLMAPARQMTIEDALQGDLTPKDRKRLSGAYTRVFNVMKDGVYRSPEAIAQESGVRLDSALRMLRYCKARGHGYEKKNMFHGLYLYRITPIFHE